MKCNSPEKVIEPGVADRAEQACLDNLGYFVEEVAVCYERVRLVIASDWRVYGDLLGTTAEAGCDYNKQVRAMTLAFPHLQWASLEDLHGEEGYSNTLPSWFEAEYGQDLASVANLIETDENRRRVHKLFSRFVREEAGPMTEDALHARAMQMMVRHDAYNALLSRFAPGHIRLSIHTTANKDNKYCVNLLDNGYHCQETTPWHGVLVDNCVPPCTGLGEGLHAPRQAGLEIVTKAQAETKGYVLVSGGPQGCYYSAQQQ